MEKNAKKKSERMSILFLLALFILWLASLFIFNDLRLMRIFSDLISLTLFFFFFRMVYFFSMMGGAPPLVWTSRGRILDFLFSSGNYLASLFSIFIVIDMDCRYFEDYFLENIFINLNNYSFVSLLLMFFIIISRNATLISISKELFFREFLRSVLFISSVIFSIIGFRYGFYVAGLEVVFIVLAIIVLTILVFLLKRIFKVMDRILKWLG